MAAKEKKSDEKLILGLGIVGAVVLLVLAVLGFTSLQSKFAASGGQRNSLAELTGEPRLDKAAQSLQDPIRWGGTQSNGRNLQLLTPIPLFLIPGHPDLIDLYADEAPVHPPIPNKWWLKHQIDPSFKNSPSRDFDGDGFTNLEEFESKTNPSDPAEYPDLLSKLSVVGHSVHSWKVVFSSDIGGDNPYQFRYQDIKNKRLRSQYLNVGARFFDAEPALSRFILKDVVEKEIDKNGVSSTKKFAQIEDTLTNKSFEIVRSSRNDFIGKDYSVEFSLNALGKGGVPFTLTQNTRFDLPDGQPSDQGKFLFLEVNAQNQAIIQFKKGDATEQLALPLN